MFIWWFAIDRLVYVQCIWLYQSSVIFQGCCAKYSVSSKPALDGEELKKPVSQPQSEAAETVPHPASNHAPAATSAPGHPPFTRAFLTLARNKTYFHLQQQTRLKGSLATDGSTLLTETSKSTTSSVSSGKDNETSSASSNDSDSSSRQTDAKKVSNTSRVSFWMNFTAFISVSSQFCYTLQHWQC